jgi:hypothetical protein
VAAMQLRVAARRSASARQATTAPG